MVKRFTFSSSVTSEIGSSYKTIKSKTQNQSVHQSTHGQLLRDNYHCSLHSRWTSYEHPMFIQLRVYVYWVRKIMFYMAAERSPTSIAHKNHFIKKNLTWCKGDNWVSSYYIFWKLNHILFQNLTWLFKLCSSLKSSNCFCFY